MTTKNNWQILVLAAVATFAVACDTFPSKPGGDPQVVRVTTYDGSVSNTVERTSAAAGNIVTTLATPGSAIFVQFNKPMDGSSIQAANSVADGVLYYDPTVPTAPCVAASNLALTGFTANTSVCNYPSSPTDGGQMAIWSLDGLVLGDTYNVSGTVRDYEGKSLPINVTVQVDDTPFATPSSSGYSITVAWWERATPGAYTLTTSADGNTYVPVPGTPTCDGTECFLAHNELQLHSSHYYKLDEVGHTRNQIGGPVELTSNGRSVTLANIAVGNVVQAGQLRATWSSVGGANGYVLSRSTDGVSFVATNYVGTSRNYPDVGLASGNTYYYRVRPTYADNTIVGDGPISHRVAP